MGAHCSSAACTGVAYNLLKRVLLSAFCQHPSTLEIWEPFCVKHYGLVIYLILRSHLILYPGTVTITKYWSVSSSAVQVSVHRSASLDKCLPLKSYTTSCGALVPHSLCTVCTALEIRLIPDVIPLEIQNWNPHYLHLCILNFFFNFVVTDLTAPLRAIP